MADCSQIQNNYVSSPSELVYGLGNLMYNIKDRLTLKTNELLGIIENATIDSHSKFMTLNYNALMRHVDINKQEKNITFELLGNDAHINGSSDSYTPSLIKPEMMEGLNYLEYAEHILEKEENGLATRLDTTSTNNSDISAFNIKNLYPKENDSITTTNTWNVGCEKNSLLYKTQKLFNDKKINTIISRFGTNAESNSNDLRYNGQVRTSYGESRGRNLLTKDAENGSGGYDINGYKNPYCRTWTNHYRYDSIYKTMRPFTETDNSGRYVSNDETKKLTNMNTWNQFEEQVYGEEIVNEKAVKKEWSWRKGNDRYNKSVMSDGLINFTPEFKGGGSSNTHTRQCMFSIENLAWKDFNPYAFENTLSWEQRGPNGGRIMWFPPYGLSFNETTQAKWQAHQFIGRGEDVYTYQGTVRSGTLSFILVVDHPSIIDYALGQHNPKREELTDNDIHRYFAGCDIETLQNTASPTPLTDEYVGMIDYSGVLLHEDLIAKNSPQKTPTTPSSSPNKITFYWYFPNNYSGVYDNRELNSSNGVVSAMKYTLMGVAGGIKRNLSVSKKEWTPQPDSILDTSETLGISDWCTGYCMGKKTPDGLKDEYLIPQQKPRFLDKTKKKNQKMTNIKDKGRFYRVDYDPSFTWPTGEEAYKNTLDQECGGKRKVENCYDYNINVPIQSENENEKNYSFLLMCCALMEVSEKQKVLLNHLKSTYPTELGMESENSVYKELVETLQKIKDNKIKIKSVISKGYSSVQQSNTSDGQKRNEYLAKQRAETMKLLFLSSGISAANIEIQNESNASIGTNDINESGENETKNRRAELIIELETEETENTATAEKKTEQTGDKVTTTQTELTEEDFKKIDEYNEIHKYVGYSKTDQKVEIDGKEYYLYQEIDNPDRLWYNTEDWIGRCEEESSINDNGAQSKNKQDGETQQSDQEFQKGLETKENEAQEKGEPLISIGAKNPIQFKCEVHKTATFDLPVRCFNIDCDVKISSTITNNNNNVILTLSHEILKASDFKKGGEIITISCTPQIYKNDISSMNEFDATITLETVEEIDGKKITATTTVVLFVDDKEKPKIITADEELGEVKLTSWRLYNEDIIKTGKFAGVTLKERKNKKNNLRYDQEYYFFKKLKVADPMIYDSLVKRLQYFDPTFHSMTPEGFNGRLTFLQQCMRQGDTLTEVEHIGEKGNIVTAKNLAFGRPPFCILRVGDFYYQTIIIENLSINYDFDGGIKWDLNSEGIGVQPLLAQVQLNIKLLGGGDLSGPIRRLQNAMSFNYYANTSLYDNRADRYEYEIDEKTGQKGELKKDNCFVYDAFTKVENIKENYVRTEIANKARQQRNADQKFGKEIAPQVKTIERNLQTPSINKYGKLEYKNTTFTVSHTESGLTYNNNNADGYKGDYNWEDDTHRPVRKEETKQETPNTEPSN